VPVALADCPSQKFEITPLSIRVPANSFVKSFGPVILPMTSELQEGGRIILARRHYRSDRSLKRRAE